MVRSESLTAFGNGAAMRFDTLLHQYLADCVGLLPSAVTATSQIYALDVACGSGQWVRMLAKTYSALDVVGLHEQSIALAYAREICWEEQIRNAYFTQGKPDGLPIQPNLFDLVRVCQLTALMPAQQWLSVLQEMVRVCHFGGHVIVQEVSVPQTNSPACAQMTKLVKAAWASSDTSGTTLAEMERLFAQALAHEVVREDMDLDLSYGTAAYQHLMVALPPLITCLQRSLIQMHVTTEQQMRELTKEVIAEVTSEKFQGIQTVTTLIGEKVL